MEPLNKKSISQKATTVLRHSSATRSNVRCRGHTDPGHKQASDTWRECYGKYLEKYLARLMTPESGSRNNWESCTNTRRDDWKNGDYNSMDTYTEYHRTDGPNRFWTGWPPETTNGWWRYKMTCTKSTLQNINRILYI